MTNKEKQEIVWNVAVVLPILAIAAVMIVSGVWWFYALCFIGVVLSVEKMIERVFSDEISNASVKRDAVLDNIYDKKIATTWLGKLLNLNKISSLSPVVENSPAAANDSRENAEEELDIDISPRVSVQSNTGGIYMGLLGQPLTERMEFLELPMESKDNGNGNDNDNDNDEENDFIELAEEKNDLPNIHLQEPDSDLGHSVNFRS